MSKGDQALGCLTNLGKLDEKGYATMIRDDVGPEILMVFEKYCKSIAPDADVNVLNTLVHLMITGYLVKSHETGASPAPSKIIHP